MVPVRAAFRRFWPYARPDRRYLVFAFLLLAVNAVAETIAIRMFGVLADGALSSGNVADFWLPGAVWAGVAVIGGIVTFASGWLVSWTAERFLLRLRDSVYAHLQTLPPDFYSDHDVGDLTARLTSDTEQIEELTTSGVVMAAGAAVTAVCYTIAAVLTSWQLALISLVLAPASWLLARLFSRRMQRVTGVERASYGAISTAVADGLTHLPLVQAYNQQQAQRQRLSARGTDWMRARVRQSRLNGAHVSVIDVVETVVLLMVIGAGVWQISVENLTVGGVLAFTSYLGYMAAPLRQLGQLGVTASAAAVSSDRIAELMQVQPRVADRPRALVLPRSSGEVVVDRVMYRYPDADAPALTDLSFTARRGELVLLTGASGAGKSTIAKLLLRFADPDYGGVRLDGYDLRQLSQASLRDHVTLIPQHAAVFHATVRDNIAFGRPSATEPEIRHAAAGADAHEFVAALPEGYETVLDGWGQRLSGGQRQRIAIARALLRDSPVLVLDEPTTGLDAMATRRVIDPLRRLAASRTLIMISHDLSIAPAADKILVLDHGRLVEQGTHDSLLAAGGHYARLHTEQSQCRTPIASHSAPTAPLPRILPQRPPAIVRRSLP